MVIRLPFIVHDHWRFVGGMQRQRPDVAVDGHQGPQAKQHPTRPTRRGSPHKPEADAMGRAPAPRVLFRVSRLKHPEYSGCQRPIAPPPLRPVWSAVSLQGLPSPSQDPHGHPGRITRRFHGRGSRPFSFSMFLATCLRTPPGSSWVRFGSHRSCLPREGRRPFWDKGAISSDIRPWPPTKKTTEPSPQLPPATHKTKAAAVTAETSNRHHPNGSRNDDSLP